MISNTLLHYRITAKLGEGGMGEVYRATDTKLGREVAIKVLPASVSRHPQSLARFEREAQALAALNRPHIAAIRGFVVGTFPRSSCHPTHRAVLVQVPTLVRPVHAP
ncbi:MAG: protein kinase [Verrucomicrobia bacterium]|nr:protein kinase [Verrucomicrobiota bacterium]